MAEKTLRPEDVFTPKGSRVNNEMFMKRHELESALTKATRKPKHIILYGESGCGKTWLYKKVLAEKSLPFEVLNAASINVTGGVNMAMESMLARFSSVEDIGYDEKKSAELNAIALKGSIDHIKKYEYRSDEPFLKLLKEISKKYNGKPSYLIIENIEHIVRDEALAKELSGLILYLDDEEYSKYNVKILIVGTLNNIKDYFSNATNSQTIINRVQEAPEVRGLKPAQVTNLIETGFIKLLKYEIEDVDEFDQEVLDQLVNFLTDGIPQYIHELCLEIAINSENNKYVTNITTKRAIHNWIHESLMSEYSRVEGNLNASGTRHGRRNQSIFAMAQMRERDFSSQDIIKKVREYFPNSTREKNINISAIISELSAGNYPIIKKSVNGKTYRFITPKVKIISRWMFSKLENEELLINRVS